MSIPNIQPQPVGWFTRLMKIIIRLFFALVIGLALGAGIYFGVNALFSNIIQSIQVNSQQIDGLETRLQLAEDQQVQRNSTITTRLQAVEISNDQQKASFDELQGRIDTLEADQAALLETATSELGKILDKAAKDQADMLAELGNLNADLKSLHSELNTLGRDFDSLQAEIDTLNKAGASGEERLQLMETEWAKQLSVLTAMDHQLQLFKAIELLTRSRYYLVQNNLGLAGQEIQTTYELLLQIEADIPDYQAATYSEILTELESAQANLPEKPVAAADHVDSAWNMLMQGLPDMPQDEAVSEPNPTPTAEATPTPTPKP